MTTHLPSVDFWSTLPRPIIGLAPMDGVTDAAFRLIVAQQGAPDVTVTEFTSVGDICRGRDTLRSFLYHDCERPIVAQLYGKDPDLFYQAAHVVAELGFDGLDINMGCPSKNVASSGSGAALIRTPDLAHEILRAARQGALDWARGQTLQAAGLKAARAELVAHMNVTRTGRPDVPRRILPVSVKTRLGYDSVIVERWISHLLDARPAVISLHGRTLTQMYRGEADWGAIARAAGLTTGTDTLILGNGDLQSMAEAVARIRETGVHGVLVGRGTLGSPWLFRTKEAARRCLQQAHRSEPDGAAPLAVEIELEERFHVMRQHARQFERLFGVQSFPRMRKHLAWYCKGMRHAAALRASMVRASSSDDVASLLSAYRSRTPDAACLPETWPRSSPAAACG